jgi:hypothetical protein
MEPQGAAGHLDLHQINSIIATQHAQSESKIAT